MAHTEVEKTYEFEPQGDGCTVCISGRVDNRVSHLLKVELFNFSEPADHDILLDLTELDYLDSAGLAVLLATFKMLSCDNRTLRITACSPQVLQVLKFSGFTQLLT